MYKVSEISNSNQTLLVLDCKNTATISRDNSGWIINKILSPF